MLWSVSPGFPSVTCNGRRIGTNGLTITQTDTHVTLYSRISFNSFNRFLRELTPPSLVVAGPGLFSVVSVALGLQVVLSIVCQDSENIPIVAQTASECFV